MANRTQDRSIIVFDVETTGTDRRRDQVIELCVQFGLGDDAPSQTWRIRPAVEISAGAQAVHGISMEDLAGCPTFGAYRDEILAIFDQAEVLVGYNLAFDIDMLQAEFERLGGRRLDLDGKKVVDAFRLWQQCEPRSLQHAHQRFVGETFAEAHSAAADVAATGRVLLGMLDSFGLGGSDWESVARVCEPERATWVGASRHLQWDEDGEVVISFGKHQGKPLPVLAAGPDSGYLRWIIDKDFPAHVRMICEKALEVPADEFRRWAQQTYGRPARQTGARGEGVAYDPA